MIKEASKARTFFDEVEEENDSKSSSSDDKSTNKDDKSQLRDNNDMLVEDKEKKANKKYVLKEKSSKYSSKSRRRKIDTKRTLESILGVTTGGPGGRRLGDPMHSERLYRLFVDLIDKMLEYDPKKRINPIEALKHQFFVEFDAVKQKINPQAQGQGDTYTLPKSTSSGNDQKNNTANLKKQAEGETESSPGTTQQIASTLDDFSKNPRDTTGNTNKKKVNEDETEKEALPRSSFEKRDAYTQTPVKCHDEDVGRNDER